MRKRLRESIPNINFFADGGYEHLASMYDADSHYYAEVYNDIISYIENHYGNISALPEDFQDLVEECREDDDVSGCMSGSYTFSRKEAYNNIFCKNDDSFRLLCLIIRDIYSDNDEGLILNKVLEDNFESLDCLIRAELCFPIIEWIYAELDDAISSSEGEVEIDDEDYDEGFDESVKRHKARIRK